MRIDIPAMLTANLRVKFDDKFMPIGVEVQVLFGEAEIVVLDPVHTVSFRDPEEYQDQVVELTVAKWLKDKLA